MDPSHCPSWSARAGYRPVLSSEARSLEQLSDLPMRGKLHFEPVEWQQYLARMVRAKNIDRFRGIYFAVFVLD